MGWGLSTVSRFGLVAAVLSVGACAAESAGTPEGGRHVTQVDFERELYEREPGSVPPAAWLRIRTLDIWARPLPAGASLLVAHDGREISLDAQAPVDVPLEEAGDYQLTLSAPDFETATVTLRFDGSSYETGLTLVRGAERVHHGQTLSHHVDDEDAAAPGAMVHSLYLGLRHAWFASTGAAPTRGNSTRLLMDAEEIWAAEYDDFLAARQGIQIATWMWTSTTELIRPPASRRLDFAPDDERRRYTALGVLERSAAEKRVLYSEWGGQDGPIPWQTADSALRAHVEDLDDGFEVLRQGNDTAGALNWQVPPFPFRERVLATFPGATNERFDGAGYVTSTIEPRWVDINPLPFGVTLPLASYHQKFATVDDRVAYVGGTNFEAADWDSSQHLVFDPRRMPFDATARAREEVAAHLRETDTPPRKDYSIRLEGPIVADVAEVFRKRWNALRQAGVAEASYASYVRAPVRSEPIAGGVEAQLTVTMPAPYDEYSVAETWFNAVRHAERFIYIESQYFRFTQLTDEIIARMRAVPGLRLVVVDKTFIDAADHFGCRWTYETMKRLRDAFPDRVAFYALRAFDTRDSGELFDETEGVFVDIYTHSKMMIVDDRFMSVGSANAYNRSLEYEAEMNVVVLDAAFVTAARVRIFQNFMDPRIRLNAGSDRWFFQLHSAAQWNDAVLQAWKDAGMDLNLDGAPVPNIYRPRGFLYSYPMADPTSCLFYDVSPDAL